jgi:hypothetical protein
MSSNFIKDIDLNDRIMNNLDKKINELIHCQSDCDDYTRKIFFDTNHIKNIISNTGLESHSHFKLTEIYYTIKNSSCFINLPLLNEQDIFEDELYEPKQLFIICNEDTRNSLFYCKLNRGVIQKKVENTICFNNIFGLYENIKQKPYFYNPKLKYNWNKKLNKDNNHTLKVLIFYNIKKNINRSVLSNFLSDKNTQNNNSEVYYINLDKDIKRREHIESNYGFLNSVRVNAVKDNQGFKGLLKTNYYLLSNLLNKNMLKECPIIMEDDCLLLDNKNVFEERWGKYKKYLKDNWGKWNYFSGGSIYIKPLRIINKDPCIVECSYGLCTQFIVHGERSAKKTINYVNSCSMLRGIDRLLCSGDDTFLVPYPFLATQLLENSNISKRMREEKYLTILRNEFKKSQEILKHFVENNIDDFDNDNNCGN